MSVLLSDMDDMDVAGAMLLIGTKNDASDKPIFASTGAVGTKRKKRDIISLTQVCAPNQAKKKKKKAAPKNKNKMGDSPTWSFSGYDDDNWQMQEYYDIDRANVPVNPERSPAQHSRASEAASVSPRKTKRKLLVQTGKGVALKGAEKPPPGNIKESKANAAADPLVLSWRYVGPDSAPSPDRYELEIEFLKRQIAEDTVKLEEAVRRKNEAVSLNRREAQRANRAVPAQQSSRSASPGQQQRDGASSSHPVNQSKVASALSAYTHHLQKLSVDTAASQTGAKGASKKQLNDRKRGKKPRRSKKKAATSFISLTPITDGGKFKFAESRDFKVDEPDDDTSIPPARKKMAEWEMQVNRGQWRRLRRFTDCRRCFGHCGAVHKKNDVGCQAAQEVRRYILKKHYMDIERKKVAEFKQANRKKTSEARRELARTMNLSNKSSISNMSKKQRELVKNRKAKAKPHAV